MLLDEALELVRSGAPLYRVSTFLGHKQFRSMERLFDRWIKRGLIPWGKVPRIQ